MFASTPQEKQQILSEFQRVFLDIRTAILPLYENNKYSIADKGGNSPVTEADILSNKLLIKFLQKFNFDIITEEESKHNAHTEYVWYIDPLDGTKDFINKTDEFSIMVALIHNNRPIFGIVYQPISQKTTSAFLGDGAFCNGEKISVSNTAHTADMALIVSRSHLHESDKQFAEKLSIKNFIQCGSVGIKVSRIAEKEADIYINSSNKTWKWDSAAADIIIHEAGGIMTDLNGKKLSYSPDNLRNEHGIIASNNQKHDLILSTLRSILNE